MNNRELYTLPNTESGFVLALDQTLSLRRAGFKTRLAQRRFLNRFDVVTVEATYPDRPNRKERGCYGNV